MNRKSDETALKTIFQPCRQCGACCKAYRKIAVTSDEAKIIEKFGGYVGVDVSLSVIRENGLDVATEQAKKEGKMFMIHPDSNGCVFLQRQNETYSCRIYHYRPQTCRGFRCNLADESFLQLYGGQDAIHLLGLNSYGLPIKT